MSIGTRNSLLLFVCVASIGIGATAVGKGAAPMQFTLVSDFTCDLSPQSPPPPISVAAINDLVGSSITCDEGNWMSEGIIMDDGSATLQDVHFGSFLPNAANRCGIVFARSTLHGSGGDIYINNQTRLFCPPGSFGLFGTSVSAFQITGGTGIYNNLIGRGKTAGTFTVDLSALTLVVNLNMEGKASFVN